MIRRISAMDARKQLGRIMNEVSIRMDSYIIERNGHPLVAVIPIPQFEEYLEEKGELIRTEAPIGAENELEQPPDIENKLADLLQRVRETGDKEDEEGGAGSVQDKWRPYLL